MAELTRAQKLLIAAGHLLAAGKETFSAEDLVVQVFREFPGDFSLKGYPEFPHSNGVFTQIMGKKAPLIVRGWLEKTGTNQYRMTDKGIDDVSDLSGTGLSTPTIRVDRQLEDKFGRLLTSDAYTLFRDDRKGEITFHHFCRFAGLSARDKWQKVAGRLQAIEHLVSKAVELGESGQTLKIHFRQRNRAFASGDLRLLGTLHGFLIERFEQEMTDWRTHALQR